MSLDCWADLSIDSGMITCSVKLSTDGKFESRLGKLMPLEACGPTELLGELGRAGGRLEESEPGGKSSPASDDLPLIFGGATGVLRTTGGFTMDSGSGIRTEGTS